MDEKYRQIVCGGDYTLRHIYELKSSKIKSKVESVSNLDDLMTLFKKKVLN